MALVYIVDDQQVNRRILGRLAQGIGPDMDIRTFEHPGQVLETMGAEEPDLIITDYNMPVMNGVQFVRELRKSDRHLDIPVIVLTVLEDKATRFEALEAGATDFLNNPVDHHEFLCRARNLLKLRQQQQTIKAFADDLKEKLVRSEKSREQIVRDNNSRLNQVVDTVPALISAVNREGRITLINESFAKFHGVDAKDAENKHLSDIIGIEAAAQNLDLDQYIYANQDAIPSHEETAISPDGTERFLLVSKVPLTSTDGQVMSVLTTALDITERKRTEEHLHELAHFDVLTGLANRFKLNDQMRRELARARRGGRKFALHLVDLDHFKDVNDVLGHQTGDNLLKVVAERLALSVRDVDTVARLGGDEFAIIQTEIASRSDAEELAQRLIDALSSTTHIEGSDIAASGSIGVALYPDDGLDSEELLKSADLAMYKAKENGRNAYCLFSEDMKTKAASQAALDADLKTGLKDNRFILDFQPFVTLANGQICGGEALIRMRRSDGGIVMPAHFLPMAEDNGNIVEINEWVLYEACRQAVKWQDPGSPPLRIAVNISPVQFRKQDVFRLVRDVLDDTGLAANLLELELTENIVMQNTGVAANVLRDIRDLGVSIAIDDFGTGYSSLSYIRTFPANRLKIDQSFIRTAVSNPSDNAIVRAVINLGHTLDMKIVAEGVESTDQVRRLIAEKCDEIQGHFISPPLSSGDFARLVGERQAMDMPKAEPAGRSQFA